ncbi:15504_t:CDS:2 [Acaulospora colombiana]|uniref:15504_t:CDS:1 n=1 Tax=Acaulospora colombiana TaxID=27376 RepID=A0ACA9LE08_9GLOM|nr:15504_t:CDS:2 [Acaulospora colombiana]
MESPDSPQESGDNSFPNEIITSDIKEKLRDSFLRDSARILKEVPPDDHNYKLWDVYVGKAGLALLFMRIHERDPGFMIGSKNALTIADQYIDGAISSYTSKHKISPSIVEHECGFLCSAVGLYAVAAYVKQHKGDQESSRRYVGLIRSHFSHACFSASTPSELLYGRAGFLYAQKFLSGTFGPLEEPHVKPLASSIFETIIEDGVRTAKSFAHRKIPLLWLFHGKPYLGAAHGMAGILSILLARPEDCRDDEKRIRDTVDFVLFNCRSANGNWPVSVDDERDKSLVQFCHGAPGMCFLACKAYQHYKEEK